jgi:hypothetical protein
VMIFIAFTACHACRQTVAAALERARPRSASRNANIASTCQRT